MKTKTLSERSGINWLAHAEKRFGRGRTDGLGLEVRKEIIEEALKDKWAAEDGEEGVNDKRLEIVESEFASVLRVLRREGNTLSPVLRNGWDGKPLRTLTKNSPLKATGAHLAIIGHVTRDELLQHLDAVEVSNGFANRFVFVLVRRSKLLPEGGNPDLTALTALSARLRDALAKAKGMGEMTRDLAARELWKAEYPRLTRDVPGLLGSVVSRAEAHVLRFSGIYAALDGTSTISPNHLRAALEVWRYCEESAAAIFGDAIGDPVADEILAALRKAPAGMTRDEIRDLFGRHQPSDRLQLALDRLAEAGFARMRTTETGGRPAEVWEAVPEGAR